MCVFIIADVLEIQGGVSSCGKGAGLCLLSDSCTVVPGFQKDPDGGHCEGVSKNNSPRAGFVCCKYVSKSNPTTSKNAKVDLDFPTETPLPVVSSVTNAPHETVGCSLLWKNGPSQGLSSGSSIVLNRELREKKN